MSNELVIPGITDANTLTYIARSRTYTQYEKSVENALAGQCPFCNVNRGYNRIIAENMYWYAWPSTSPEKHTKFHFLFVPKRHVIDSEELKDSEMLMLWGRSGIRRQVRQMYGYTSRGTLMRDGDATLSAGTIQHLHIHDMIPDGTGRVESPFYKGIEAEVRSLVKACIFEKMRVGGGLIAYHLLNAEEKSLIEGCL